MVTVHCLLCHRGWSSCETFSILLARLQSLHLWYHLERNLAVKLHTLRNHVTASLFDSWENYLTQAVDADIRTVLRAKRPILDFAGQSEEEIIAFGKAVQLTHVLILGGTKTTRIGKTLPPWTPTLPPVEHFSYHPLWCMASRCSTSLWTVCCWTLHTAGLCSRWCLGDNPRCYKVCTTWWSRRRTCLRMQVCRGRVETKSTQCYGGTTFFKVSDFFSCVHDLLWGQLQGKVGVLVTVLVRHRLVCLDINILRTLFCMRC